MNRGSKANQEKRKAWNKNQKAHESGRHAIDTEATWFVSPPMKHTKPGMLNSWAKFAEWGKNGQVKVIMPMK